MSLIEYNFETLQHCDIALNFTGVQGSVPLITHHFGPLHEVSTRVGKASGAREWTLRAPVLFEDDTHQVTGTRDGENFSESWRKYLWDFYLRHRAANNRPFYIYQPTVRRTFLVSFTNETISEEIFTAALSGSGDDITVRQREVPGMIFREEDGSVFLPSDLTPWGRYRADTMNTVDWVSEGLVEDDTGNEHHFFKTMGADVERIPDALDDKAVLVFNATDDDGILSCEDGVLINTVVMVLKINEAAFRTGEDTFGAGVFSTSGAENPILVGAGAETTFFDFDPSGEAPYIYAKNNTVFDHDDQQAPMEEWAVVRASLTGGFAITAPQIGLDRDKDDTDAKMSLAEWWIFEQAHTPTQADLRDLTRYLQMYWGRGNFTN